MPRVYITSSERSICIGIAAVVFRIDANVDTDWEGSMNIIVTNVKIGTFFSFLTAAAGRTAHG